MAGLRENEERRQLPHTSPAAVRVPLPAQLRAAEGMTPPASDVRGALANDLTPYDLA